MKGFTITSSDKCFGSNLPFSEGYWIPRDLLGGGFKSYLIFTPVWRRFPLGLIFFKWVETEGCHDSHFQDQDLGLKWKKPRVEVETEFGKRRL